METVTKIDITGNSIFCYDELANTQETYSLTSEYDFFINAFSDTQDLLTVNIYNPLPRIVKFYNINESVPNGFINVDYDSMTEEQKEVFDSFITLIKNK
jgi:hypothetical protein